MSKKDSKIKKKNELIEEAKKSEIYRSIIEKFPDAKLTDIKFEDKKDDWF